MIGEQTNGEDLRAAGRLLAAATAIAGQFCNNGAGFRYSPVELSHWQPSSERVDVP